MNNMDECVDAIKVILASLKERQNIKGVSYE